MSALKPRQEEGMQRETDRDKFKPGDPQRKDEQVVVNVSLSPDSSTPETGAPYSYDEAVEHVRATGKATIQSLKKRFPGLTDQVAKMLLQKLENDRVIGPVPLPGKPREVLPVSTSAPKLVEKKVPQTPPEDPSTTQPGLQPALQTAPASPPPPPPNPPATPPKKAGIPLRVPATPILATAGAGAGTPPPGGPKPREATPSGPEAVPTPPATPEAKKPGFFRSAFERFVSKFSGEVQPEDEKDYKGTWNDAFHNTATGTIGVAASLLGVKFIGDLVAKGYQLGITNPEERDRIIEQFLDAEETIEHSTPSSPIEAKKAKLEAIINESKFLTKEKKADLLQKITKTVDDFETKAIDLREQRNRQIDRLLEEAIQSRVKNTQLFKEGINTVLAGAVYFSGGTLIGLQGLRGPAYGAIAAYERYQTVAEERTKGERKGSQFNEWVVKGFTETMHNLVGGGADTWQGKALNTVKGATNVMRAVGFTSLTIDALNQTGLIDQALSAMETYTGISVNISDAFAPDAILATPGPEAPDEGTVDPLGESQQPHLAESDSVTGKEITGRHGNAIESPYTESQINAGLVKKGDGMMNILERQGIKGASALESAREAGIIRAGGDTRLTSEAIGRLSIITQANPEGGIDITFFDTQTDNVLTLDQAREAGFTYESGTFPGEIPTDKDLAEQSQDSFQTREPLMDSPAPNELLDGSFQILVDDAGQITGLDIGKGEALSRINQAMHELNAAGFKDSPEMTFLSERFTQIALYYDQKNIDIDALLDPTKANVLIKQMYADDLKYEPPVAGEPMGTFKGDTGGRVRFGYNDATGEVENIILRDSLISSRRVRDGLERLGLSKSEVRAFADVTQDRNREFILKSAAKLDQQMDLLDDMKMQKLEDTPEYTFIQKETRTLEKSLESVVKMIKGS